ncbi:MAG: tRNA (adenosine(37)-N6)-dimethylallyltransferase MiaA [Bacteroidales bacterium]
MPRLVVITGPTGVGKTAASIGLARRLGTVILSCDSRQMYREMRIGTAVPSPPELAEVKHYFIGNLSIREDYSIFRYEREAMSLLDSLFPENPTIILTGGSGLYQDALINGVDEIPDPDPAIRAQLKARLEAEGIATLSNQLEELDPIFYQQLDRQNPARVIRALEVCLTAGRPFSSFRTGRRANRAFDIILLGLERPRHELYQRIDARVDQMMAQGLEEEARQLMPFRHRPALNTVGYKELFRYFDREYDLTEAVRLIKRNSRHYAKRQITWNRRYEGRITWFNPDRPDDLADYVTSL